MTDNHNLPLALQRAHMAFWARTGELLQESRSRWLDLAHHALVRDMRETPDESRQATPASDWDALAWLPMGAGWQLLNRSMNNTRDLTLTAFNCQTNLGTGMQRALAQWHRDTAQALHESRNATPSSSTRTNPAQATAQAPAEPAEKQQQPWTPAPVTSSANLHRAGSITITLEPEEHTHARTHRHPAPRPPSTGAEDRFNP